MNKKKVVLISILVVLFVPVLIALLALQNPPWVHSPLIKTGQTLVSRLVLSNLDVVAISKSQNMGYMRRLPSSKRAALKKDSIEIIAASALRRTKSEQSAEKFTIVIIEPTDLKGKDRRDQRRVITAVDDFAIRNNIDAIVEATVSDTLRNSAWGIGETRRLHDAGVIRCVIFDGGHHVGSLPLAPDILLVPITYLKGKPYAGHWFTRDAVPVQKLKAALDEGGVESVIAQFPRFGLPVKNKEGMGRLAAQAILKATQRSHTIAGTRVVAERRKLPPHQKVTANGREHRLKTDSLFLSLSTGRHYRKENILKRLKGEFRMREEGGEHIRCVYVGLTFGASSFPHLSEKVGCNGEELRAFLNKHLPQEIVLISEPLSVWDIYCSRIGFYRIAL